MQRLKWRLTQMLQGHFTKIIKQNNTLSVSEGGLEVSCFFCCNGDIYGC